jgi:glycosyltransferase involved in cell wall biosynthesis
VRGLRVAYAAFEPFPNAKGSGTRIAELVRGLAEAGAEVRLLTLPGGGTASLPPGVEHRALRVADDNLLRRALLFRAAVARELVAARPDVVHFRGVFEGQAARAYAGRGRALTVFEVNGLPSVELVYHHRAIAGAHDFQGKLRALEQDTLRAASLVLTQSRTTLGFLERRAPLARARVIANAADPSAFSPEPSPPRDGVARLLYAGTVAPWQGTAELLMATRRCLRARPLRLRLIGPVRRAWRKQIERFVRRLGIDGAVELSGPLARAELACAIAASDVCVAPLRKDARNGVQGASPIKLFEYMAAGRAVVSTDLPCVREIVDPERTGLLAGSSRPSLLAAAIERCAADPALAARLGRAARDEIARSATWSHRRAELVEAYRALPFAG